MFSAYRTNLLQHSCLNWIITSSAYGHFCLKKSREESTAGELQKITPTKVKLNHLSTQVHIPTLK